MQLLLCRYKCCMSFETIATLGQAAMGHWGMLTTAQAAEAGVSRATLARMAAGGALEHVAQGVYRMAGTPAVGDPAIDALRVHWLALGGASRTVIAAGKSAAALHRVGDWPSIRADPVDELCSRSAPRQLPQGHR